MTQKKSVRDFNEKLLKGLYSGNFILGILVDFKGKKVPLQVKLQKDDGDYDCLMENTSLGVKIQSPKGEQSDKYCSFSYLKRSCLRILKTNGVEPILLRVFRRGSKEIVLTERVV